MTGGGRAVIRFKMANTMKSFSKFLIAVIVLGCFWTSGRAQDQQPMTLEDAVNGYQSVTNGRAGVVDDASTHHLIFSQPVPGTATYDKVTHDPRFWMQQIKRSLGVKTVVDGETDDTNAAAKNSGKQIQSWKSRVNIKNDWTSNLTTGAVQPNAFPAKFSFGTSTASCANDFVVYPTGGAGTTAAVPAVGSVIISYADQPIAGETITINGVVYTFETTLTAAGQVLIGSTEAHTAANLYAAINATASECGNPTGGPCFGSGTTANAYVTATYTAGGQVVNFTAKTAGTAGNAYTLATTDANAYLSNATLVGGSAGGVANIIAYNELYGTATTGCKTTVPSVLWAYDTGGTATTSPTISNDSTGSQIAFIQVSGTTASLVLLKWKASGTETLAAPGTPTTEATGTAYRSCTAPCMYSVSLGANDTYSAPFYDYASDDALYVGDDSGRLHKITGVFNGTTIGEASGWPVTLNAADKTTSPTYDNTSGYVFAGNTGGILYAVGTGNAGTTNASIHGTSSSLGDVIIDAPLVDSSAARVYVFVATNSAGDNAVYQFMTSFTTGTGNGTATGTEVGTGGTGYYLNNGTFDNVYYSSSDPPTGNLWVAGNTGVAGGAQLYYIPITSNALGATSTLIVTDMNERHYAWYSPLTEFCNNGTSACVVTTGGTCGTGVTCTSSGTDYLFFSTDHAGQGMAAPFTITVNGTTTDTNCQDHSGNGCIFSFTINEPTAISLSGSLNVINVGYQGDDQPGCYPTSGIVVDNSVPTATLAGASEIYYIGLNGNTAGGPTYALNPYVGTSSPTSPSASNWGSGHQILATQLSQSAP